MELELSEICGSAGTTAAEAKTSPQAGVPFDPNLNWIGAPDLSELTDRMILLAKERRPTLVESTHTVPAAHYLDDDRLRAETEEIFRKTPLLVALSAEIPNNGDFKTLELCQTPLLLVRGDDGIVRGFHNACLHRGTAVVQEKSGSSLKRLSCPWHAWCYDLKGALVALPFDQGFPDVKARSGVALKSIAVEEGHGLIFAHLGGENFSIDSHLSGLADHVTAFGWKDFEISAIGERSLTTPVNWKLLFDTFCENYHFAPLHGAVLPLAMSNVAAYDIFGHHVRETFANQALLKPNSLPGHLFSMIYLIFPNVVLLPFPDSGMLFMILPGSNAGESTLVNLRVFRKGLEPDVRAAIEAGYEYSWFDIVIPQDIPVTRHAMTAMRAGSISELTFGRNEGALQHFHRLQDEILASPDRLASPRS